MSFKNKTIIITGGAQGIGGSCTTIFHREKGNVVILDVDETAGKALSERLGDRAIFIKCNVSQESEVKSAMEQAIARFGSLDVLVNNAGILRYASVTDTTEEEWDLMMDINLKGFFLCAKHALPHMMEKGDGVVINMSSAQAHTVQENVAAYCTTKTAVLGLTRSIAVDYAPQVRCVAICPGTVDTPMNRKAFQLSPDPEAVLQETKDMHVLKRIADPDEIGELVAFVASNKSPFITGQDIRIDGGLGIKTEGSKKN
ncbi:MAG: glucose 1-dehydrogenase [Balneolales bacterium]